MSPIARSAAAALLCSAGLAQAQSLYLSEYQFQNARMSSMNLDGSNPQLLFTLPPAQWLPLGLSFSPSTQRFTWMDSAGSSEVLASDLNGANAATIANVPGFCKGVSLDAQGRIYFGSNNSVMRVNADGSNLTIIFTSASTDPVSAPRVDATNAHVYVGCEGQIKRMDLDGSNIKTVVYGISQPRAIGLDIAAGRIYWLDADTISDHVGRARLDGTDYQVLIDASPSVVQSPGLIDLVVDPTGGNVFWADELVGQVYRADLNGQNNVSIFTSTGGATPSGMVLSTGEPVQPMQDCNNNSVPDDQDIALGAPDCDNNGVIDTCQVNPCPVRNLFVNNGTDPANSQGRALGWPSQWQIFQPFDVPSGGWTIGEIGLDGYTSNYADGSGLTVTLFPDNGTGTRPDETSPLGSAPAQLRFSTNYENWVYAPIAATLPAGRHWLRIEANDPIVYAGTMNFGTSGLQSISRGSSGNFSSPAQPVAIRIVEAVAQACYANCDQSTTAPVLNVQDFGCFLNAFAAGNSYANCDGSTATPVLNVQDFGCFLNAFAAGCP